MPYVALDDRDDMPLVDLPVSLRAWNVLMRLYGFDPNSGDKASIESFRRQATLGSIKDFSLYQLGAVRGCGWATLREIVDTLFMFGVRLSP